MTAGGAKECGAKAGGASSCSRRLWSVMSAEGQGCFSVVSSSVQEFRRWPEGNRGSCFGGNQRFVCLSRKFCTVTG